MIRKTKSLTLPAIIGFMVACSPFAQAADATAKPDYELDIEANIAVRFYNAYEPMLWSAMHITESVEENIVNFEERLQSQGKDWNGYFNWSYLSGRNRDFNSTVVRIPNFFPKEQATVLRDTSDKLKANVIELMTVNDTLADYFKNREYKPDEGKKYTAARARLVELIKTARTNLFAFNEPALKLAQQGEARALAENPCGIYLLHMREVLDLVDQLPPLVTNPALKPIDSYNRKTPAETAEQKSERMALANTTADQIDAISAKIAELAAKYKEDNTDAIKAWDNSSAQETCLRNLKRFYTERCPDLFENIKNLSAELRKKGSIRDASRVANEPRWLTQLHDEFVEMYNNWSGGDVAIKRGEAS